MAPRAEGTCFTDTKRYRGDCRVHRNAGRAPQLHVHRLEAITASCRGGGTPARRIHLAEAAVAAAASHCISIRTPSRSHRRCLQCESRRIVIGPACRASTARAVSSAVSPQSRSSRAPAATDAEIDPRPLVSGIGGPEVVAFPSVTISSVSSSWLRGSGPLAQPSRMYQHLPQDVGDGEAVPGRCPCTCAHQREVERHVVHSWPAPMLLRVLGHCIPRPAVRPGKVRSSLPRMVSGAPQ